MVVGFCLVMVALFCFVVVATAQNVTVSRFFDSACADIDSTFSQASGTCILPSTTEADEIFCAGSHRTFNVYWFSDSACTVQTQALSEVCNYYTTEGTQAWQCGSGGSVTFEWDCAGYSNCNSTAAITVGSCSSVPGFGYALIRQFHYKDIINWVTYSGQTCDSRKEIIDGFLFIDNACAKASSWGTHWWMLHCSSDMHAVPYPLKGLNQKTPRMATMGRWEK